MSSPNGPAKDSVVADSANLYSGNSRGLSGTDGVFDDPTILTAGDRRLLCPLEIPFDPGVIDWRVTNASKNGKLRGQVIPYPISGPTQTA